MRILLSILLLCTALLKGYAGGSDITLRWQQHVSDLEEFVKPIPELRNFLTGSPLSELAVRDSLLSLYPTLTGPAQHWALFSIGALTQKDASIDHNEYWIAFEDLASTDFTLLWVAGLKAYQLGEVEWAFRFWEECHRGFLQEGWRRVPPFAITLLRMGTENWEIGKRVEGQRLLQTALWFDPGTPVTQIWQLGARELGEGGGGGLFTRLWWLVSDLPNLMNDFQVQSLVLFNMFTFWQVLVYGVFLVWLLFLTLHYLPLFLHRNTHFLPAAMPLFWKYMVFYCLLACLPLLGFGWFLCSFLALLIVWNALTPWDKRLAMLFLLILFLAPFDIIAEKALTQPYQTNSLVYLYQRVLDEGGNQETIELIDAIKPKGKFQASLREVALSIAYRKLGNYSLSMEHASKATLILPITAQAHHNLGNSYFLLSKLEEAGQQYNKALEKRSSAATLFNLSQVHLYSNQSGPHGKFLQDAIHADRRLLAWIEANDRLFLNGGTKSTGSWPILQRTLDLPLSLTDSFLNSWEELAWKDWWSWSLPGVWIDVPAVLWPVVILLFSIIVWFKPPFISSWIWEKGASRCYSCGTLICQNCRRGAYCHHCNHQLEGIEQKSLKKDLIARLARERQAKLRWLGFGLNLVLPGLGIAYLGSKWLGYMGLWISTVLGFSFLFSKQWAHFYPYPAAEHLSQLLLMSFGVWYGLQVLLAAWKAWLWKPRTEDE